MPTAACTIRQIGIDELDTATNLRAAMNAEMQGIDPDLAFPGWRARFHAFFEERLRAERAALYVAEAPDRACGLASVYLMVNHRTEIFRQPSAYITSVYVVPEQRRQRIATRLTQACIDWAKARGCDQVRLRTSDMGRAVYVAMGFSPSNELEMRLKG